MWRELLRKCGIETAGRVGGDEENPTAEDQNLLFSMQQILYLLTSARDKKTEIQLLFKGEELSHSSRVMQVLREQRRFLVRKIMADGDIDANNSSNNDRVFNLTFPYKSASIMLTCSVKKEVLFDGVVCYLIEIPLIALLTEMRSFARVRLHHESGVNALISLNQIDYLRSPVKDIGENGFRIGVDRSQKELLAAEQGLVDARLMLSGYGIIEIKVRIRTCIENSNCVDMGFEILQIDEKSAHTLRRYMLKSTALHLLA